MELLYLYLILSVNYVFILVVVEIKVRFYNYMICKKIIRLWVYKNLFLLIACHLIFAGN